MLFLLIALLVVYSPGFAQQSFEQTSIPPSNVNLGDIGKEKINLVYVDSLKHPGDMEWFKFNVNEPQTVFLAVEERDTYHGIILYDKNMNYVNSGELILPVMLQPGTYYARVEAYPIGVSDYQALNDSLAYTLLAGNSFEKESNDGLKDATDIGILEKPIMVAGEVDPTKDIDFFKFDITGDAGRLEISALSNSLMSDYIDVVLYRNNKSEERYLPMISNAEDMQSIVVKPGSYFAKVERPDSYYDDRKDYVLYLNLSRWETQYIGILNQSAVLNESGSIRESDVDFYEFEVPEPMNVSIETSGEDGDSKICLYDSELNEIECNDDYSGRWSYLERSLQAGTYYIEVGSFSSELSYNLTVKTINETSRNGVEDYFLNRDMENSKDIFIF